VNVAVGVKTDVGRVREVNEDRYLVNAPLFVVADGMGGHVAGDVASATAVQVIEAGSARASSEQPESLARLLKEANSAVWEKARSDSSLSGMGTTCTLVLIDGSTAHIAHVGDSRAYLMSNGALTQLTEDHNLVGRMVKEGRLNAEEARHHPQRNVITRVLGVDSDVKVDLRRVDLAVGDRIVVCSDGLSSMIDEPVIEKTLSDEPDPQAAADRLVDLAVEAGGEDNITVVVVEMREGEGASVPRSSGGGSSAATEPDAEPEQRARGSGRTAWVKRAVVALVILVALAVGGFFAAQWALDNSFYIAADAGGAISIYRGIPEEVAGFEFRDVERETSLSLDELPDTQRSDLREGMKVDSLQDAEDTIDNLKALSREFKDETSRNKDKT
jgi:serine/threonine protein phosphatase PrpC